jgi:hypothetical protein
VKVPSPSSFRTEALPVPAVTVGPDWKKRSIWGVPKPIVVELRFWTVTSNWKISVPPL